MKISELDNLQRGRFGYLLENRTHVGFITAGQIARGEYPDIEVEESFIKAELNPDDAKWCANEVEKESPDRAVLRGLQAGIDPITVARYITKTMLKNNREALLAPPLFTSSWAIRFPNVIGTDTKVIDNLQVAQVYKIATVLEEVGETYKISDSRVPGVRYTLKDFYV